MQPSRAVFAPILAALLLIAVGTAAAVQSGRAGLSFLARLNIPEPTIATIPRTPRPSNPPLTGRVVLVIADGLSLRSAYNLPYLDELRRAGLDGSAVSHDPTISRPNYVSIVTGVPPKVSGVRTNDFRWKVRLDSIMRQLRTAGHNTAFVSDSSGGFPRMFAHDMEDVVYAPWPGGAVNATRLALRRQYPLVILLPGAVDNAGHLHGADSDEYRAAAIQVDRELRAALRDLDLTRDTVIIVADHGHTDSGGHGGVEPEVVQVPLVMAGSGIRPGAALKSAQLIDVSATIAALLGVPAPEHSLGRTLVEALNVDAATAARLAAADRSRITRNQAVVRANRELARVTVATTRLRRLALALAAIALGVILLVLGRRWGAIRTDLRVLAFGLPAFPLAFYGLLEVAGNHFSLSSLPDEGTGATRVFHYGLVAIVVHVLASWFALRGRIVLRDRLAAANALTLCGLISAALPAMLAWAIYGGGPYVDLPGPKMLFLIPALYIAVSTFAIAAAVTITLEVIIFFARVFDPRLPLRRAARRLARERDRLAAELDRTPPQDKKMAPRAADATEPEKGGGEE